MRAGEPRRARQGDATRRDATQREEGVARTKNRADAMKGSFGLR